MTRDFIARWICRWDGIAPGFECIGPPRWWIPYRLRMWALARVIERAARMTAVPLEDEHGEML